LAFILNIAGVFLFSFYIIYDTQLTIGNKSNKLSEDDYILAVMMLYLDIINLFIYILSFFGNSK
jgi:FtsH-binding integral membrane protein